MAMGNGDPGPGKEFHKFHKFHKYQGVNAPGAFLWSWPRLTAVSGADISGMRMERGSPWMLHV